MTHNDQLSTNLNMFPVDIPNRAILSAAIEGRSKSRLVADTTQTDPKSSGAALVHCHNGTVFVGHGVSQSFLESTLLNLRREQRIVLAMTRHQESEYDWGRLGDLLIVERYEYTNLDFDVVSRLLDQLPANRTIVRIDRDLFRQCTWHEEMRGWLGNEEYFLYNAAGVCQMDGESIVTEAYAISSENAGTEIGGITHQPYRRAGNAAVTFAYLIADYLRGFTPIFWSCNQDNLASANTAKRIGFRDRREYRFIIMQEADK